MNTVAAAAQAHVTTATIRTWCRRGVVAAIKQAGRWIIDTASLAARIAIGAMRAKTRKAATIDLAATYSWTPAGTAATTTVTTKVTTMNTPDGVITAITGLAPLLAGHIDAIQDEASRLHTLTVLSGAEIVYCDTPDDELVLAGGVTTLDRGQVAVFYAGTSSLPVQAVVDLALKLRTQLGL
ncbi:hypothetical protein [Streptomyces zaomyceticus]|uniref:hypothetical protein n=1 Tax=Streptomyces zaomyceticus TaxID=68286 RepID=UPI0033AFD4B5